MPSYIGKNKDGIHQMLVKTENKPLPWSDSNYFKVRKGLRKDGLYTTLFTLISKEYKEPFIEFCIGLIDILKKEVSHMNIYIS